MKNDYGTVEIGDALANWLGRRPFVREQFEVAGGLNADSSAAELARFFALTRVTDEPLAMINPNIDLLWHKFLEFTAEYEQFCSQEFGGIIHHLPRTSTTPVPDLAVRNFYDQYAKYFGALPAAWEAGTPTAVTRYGRRQSDALPADFRWSGWPGRPRK